MMDPSFVQELDNFLAEEEEELEFGESPTQPIYGATAKNKMFLETPPSEYESDCDTPPSKVMRKEIEIHMRDVEMESSEEKENLRRIAKTLTRQELEDLFLQKVTETITLHSQAGKWRTEVMKLSQTRNRLEDRLRQLVRQVTSMVKVLKVMSDRMDTDIAAGKPRAVKYVRTVGVQVSSENIMLEEDNNALLAELLRLQNFDTVGALQQKTIKSEHGKNMEGMKIPVSVPTLISPSTNVMKPTRNGQTNTFTKIGENGTTKAQIQNGRYIALSRDNGINLARNGLVIVKRPEQNGFAVCNNGKRPLLPAIYPHPPPLVPNRIQTPTPDKAPFINTVIARNPSPAAAPNSSKITETFFQFPSALSHPRMVPTILKQKPKTSPVNEKGVPVTEPQPKSIPSSSDSVTKTITTSPQFSPQKALIPKPDTGSSSKQIPKLEDKINPVTSNEEIKFNRSASTSVISAAPTPGCSRSSNVPQARAEIERPNVPQPQTDLDLPPFPPPTEPKPERTPYWAPPTPTLKLEQGKTGHRLVWTMELTKSHCQIESYQIYAYPQAVELNRKKVNSWKFMQDLKAKPLPMACNLSGMQSGYRFFFIIRAVDENGRCGNFSNAEALVPKMI